MLNDGITEREFNRAKTQAVNSLYMNSESNLTLMRLYGRSMLKFNELFNLDKEAENYRAVTIDDVNEIAELFLKPYACAYVGPQSNQYDFVAKLKIK